MADFAVNMDLDLFLGNLGEMSWEKGHDFCNKYGFGFVPGELWGNISRMIIFWEIWGFLFVPGELWENVLGRDHTFCTKYRSCLCS